MSAALLPGVGDEAREPLDFLVAQAALRFRQERRDGLLRRSIEERQEQVLEGRAAGPLGRDDRAIDVPALLENVREMALVFEDAQHRAHGRVTGRVREA